MRLRYGITVVHELHRGTVTQEQFCLSRSPYLGASLAIEEGSLHRGLSIRKFFEEFLNVGDIKRLSAKSILESSLNFFWKRIVPLFEISGFYAID